MSPKRSPLFPLCAGLEAGSAAPESLCKSRLPCHLRSLGADAVTPSPSHCPSCAPARPPVRSSVLQVVAAETEKEGHPTCDLPQCKGKIMFFLAKLSRMNVQPDGMLLPHSQAGTLCPGCPAGTSLRFLRASPPRSACGQEPPGPSPGQGDPPFCSRTHWTQQGHLNTGMQGRLGKAVPLRVAGRGWISVDSWGRSRGSLQKSALQAARATALPGNALETLKCTEQLSESSRSPAACMDMGRQPELEG